MQLTQKALRFVAEAIRHEIERLVLAEANALTDDERSDVMNDRRYFEILLVEMEQAIQAESWW